MVMDELYIKSMELHIEALKQEIDVHDRLIEDNEKVIEITTLQRDVSYSRLNLAFKLLNDYKNGSPSE
jgi:hypothetical protein